MDFKLIGIELEIVKSWFKSDLTPMLLQQELLSLSKYAGNAALKDFPVVITHRKPGGGREEKIKQQLEAMDLLGVQLIFPEQGKKLQF